MTTEWGGVAANARLTNVLMLPEEADQARDALARLVEEASADAGLLLLRSGQVAASHLERALPDVDTLGALLAANFASAREIARMVGETGFTSQFQQGTTRQVVTQAVGDGWLLSVVFGPVSQLGLVRLLVGRAAQEFEPLYVAARDRAADPERAATDPAFRAAAQGAIDNLFREPA